MYSVSSFLDLRRLSKAFKRRLLLLGYCSTSLPFSLSAGNRIEADFRGSEGYRLLALRFGVVGLLDFGVVGRIEFGVIGLFERDPERKSGNRYGETVLFSNSFLGMVEVKEKIADRWEDRGEGDGERPLLTVDDGVSLIVARTAFLN